MNKLLITATFFIVFIFASQAQEKPEFIKNKTTFGIKGGVNTNYLNSFKSENSLGTDLYFGLFSETRLSKKWSIQNELLYSMTTEYRFFEIPIFAKYNLNNKWSFFAGPRLDFSTNNGTNYSLERANISAVIGTQYNISKRFFIEGQLNLGITNQAYGRKESNYNKGFKKNGFRFGIGYKF